MHIAIYSRKSIYSDKSDSIEHQISMCKEYAIKYNADTISVYEDEGYTGANTDRPGFTKLMEDIKSQKLTMLICYKIDRISRNVLDFSTTFNIMQENNVEFVSVKEQIDTSTPLGRAMMYICSVFAQMERETIAERVKDNMIELAKSGKWPGGKAPIGYKREKVCIGGKYHTILTENKNELEYLNKIYDTFLQGFSLGGLETFFRKKNIQSLNGNYLSASQLHQILTTPHYVEDTPEVYDFFKAKGCIMARSREDFTGTNGLLVYGRTSGGKKRSHITNAPDRWIVAIGKHQPIITADKWLSVQERFGLNMIDKTRKHEIGLLKSIVKCKCGYTMRVQHKVDHVYHKVYDNYYCQNRNRRGVEYCDMHMVSVAEIDGALTDLLIKIKANKAILDKYIKNNVPINTLRLDKDIRSDISIAEKKIKKLTDVLQENSASSATKYIIKEIEALDNQIIGLNYELRESVIREKEYRSQISTTDDIYTEICAYINKFDSINYDSRVSFLHKIIKTCTWTGYQLIVEF